MRPPERGLIGVWGLPSTPHIPREKKGEKGGREDARADGRKILAWKKEMPGEGV